MSNICEIRNNNLFLNGIPIKTLGVIIDAVSDSLIKLGEYEDIKSYIDESVRNIRIYCRCRNIYFVVSKQQDDFGQRIFISADTVPFQGTEKKNNAQTYQKCINDMPGITQICRRTKCDSGIFYEGRVNPTESYIL